MRQRRAQAQHGAHPHSYNSLTPATLRNRMTALERTIGPAPAGPVIPFSFLNSTTLNQTTQESVLT